MLCIGAIDRIGPAATERCNALPPLFRGGFQMSQPADVDIQRSALEVGEVSDRSRAALREASYFHKRANEHRLIGERSSARIALVHAELAAAYIAAATAVERGEVVNFSGWHRAEPLRQPLQHREELRVVDQQPPGAPTRRSSRRT